MKRATLLGSNPKHLQLCSDHPGGTCNYFKLFEKRSWSIIIYLNLIFAFSEFLRHLLSVTQSWEYLRFLISFSCVQLYLAKPLQVGLCHIHFHFTETQSTGLNMFLFTGWWEVNINFISSSSLVTIYSSRSGPGIYTIQYQEIGAKNPRTVNKCI